MALNADFAADRRRLKRRLTAWRLVAVLAVIAVAVVLLGRERIVGRDHVARLTVDGVILEDRERDRALQAVAVNPYARALVVHIDSPGGTVVGGESLYHSLRQVAEQKPVVAVMGGMATSAAYMTAIASDQIFGRAGTLTGSIGVILQTTDVTGLLDKLGIEAEAIKSGPYKAQPNPLEEFSPEAREAIRTIVMDIHEMFVSLVEARRPLSREEVIELADGRVYTGRQAVTAGLIDALGNDVAARAWLAEEHDVAATLPVRDLRIGGPERLLRDMLSAAFGKTVFSEILKLDGLVSVWHLDR
ncbi:MAG: signal peptide peptidase SppA [Rhodospirillales bacterium]|nr:MAG: signal peptide peptidase SppA [Rhodospirillales bacterium]